MSKEGDKGRGRVLCWEAEKGGRAVSWKSGKGGRIVMQHDWIG